MSAFEEARCIGQHWLFDSTDPEIHKQAKELCADCPALLACRDLLIDVQSIAKTMCAAGGGARGTWAGQLIGKDSKCATAKCGTDSGYFRHRRAKDEPCDDCREAHSRAESARYVRRRAREAS